MTTLRKLTSDYQKDMNQKATSHAYPSVKDSCIQNWVSNYTPMEEGTVFANHYK